MHKSAFLGCGKRARAHACAYEFAAKGKPAAACDLVPELLTAFCDDFNIPGRYTDVHEMLSKEKPDLLHIVTLPALRVPLMTIASEHKVPVVIVEKPIAVQGEDWKKLIELDKNTKTKFVVNTQLHFHARNLELKRCVADGRIGKIEFIDVSARSTILDQGVHVLELAHSYNGFAKPAKVFAQVSGNDTIATKQPSPDTAAAAISFDNGVRAQMLTGYFAPRTNPAESIYHHKRVAVYGSKGFVHWTMAGWERSTPGHGYASGEHDYKEEDDRAQGALTDSAFELLEDSAIEHGTRLELSLGQFNIILGAYMSALHRKPIDLPCDPEDGLLDSLQTVLAH